jgi:hypothetical protein
MVVIQRVEVAEHSQCFNLGPTSPCSYHGHSPVFVPDPVLTSTTAERVGTKQCPGLVPQVLQVSGECMAEYASGLLTTCKQFGGRQRWVALTRGSAVTTPCLFTLRKRGPVRSVSFP